MAKYLILQETRRNGFITVVFFPPVVCVKHEIFILIALNAKVNLNSRRFLGLRGKKKNVLSNILGKRSQCRWLSDCISPIHWKLLNILMQWRKLFSLKIILHEIWISSFMHKQMNLSWSKFCNLHLLTFLLIH